MTEPSGPKEPKPAKGNVLSNIRVQRTFDVYIAVEHPKGWGEDDLKAAIEKRAMDFGAALNVWSSSPAHTSLTEVYLDEFDPDDRYAKPFELTAEDLPEGAS